MSVESVKRDDTTKKVLSENEREATHRWMANFIGLFGQCYRPVMPSFTRPTNREWQRLDGLNTQPAGRIYPSV